MFVNARMRTRDRSTTYSRNPGRLKAPADPASTQVVTPDRAATLSASIPKYPTPRKTCVCRSMSPGVTSRPAASMTRTAESAGIVSSTAAMRPFEIATSNGRLGPRRDR